MLGLRISRYNKNGICERQNLALSFPLTKLYNHNYRDLLFGHGMTSYSVAFEPSGKQNYIEVGKTVFEAAQSMGVELKTLCGGRQICGKCKVKFEEGFFPKFGIYSKREHLSPPREGELRYLGQAAIADGYRLSCAATILGDLVIFVPEESRAIKEVLAKTATAKPVLLKPAIRNCYVELPPPSLGDTRSDWERLSEELARNFNLIALDIDYYAMRSLSNALRSGDWKVTVTTWTEHHVIKVKPGLVERSFGLAIDIGTTTLAAYLCDLSTGQIIATRSVLNPQVSYGEDIISRITYVTDSLDGLNQLNNIIMETLNSMVFNLASEAGITAEDIDEATVVGNTAMHHIFLKLDPQYLGRSPFTSTIRHSLDIKARDIGFKINPVANVHVMPIEASFVGADNVAAIISEEPYNQDEMVLIIDIGTNGELVLGNRQRLISASCATGPAFEGANINFGMRASSGAIEKIAINPKTYDVRFKVIGDVYWSHRMPRLKACGICGSGIIDAVAEMLHAKIIKPSGTFNKNIPSPRLLCDREEPEFVIAWPYETTLDQEITISQGDVRAVQLAKGALLAGAKILMKRMNIERLDKVILAGAFGLHIDKEKAMAIGLFPNLKLSQVYSVGNAAGEGARLALLNVDKRSEAAEIARRVEYVELSTDPSFTEEFVKAMTFPTPKNN